MNFNIGDVVAFYRGRGKTTKKIIGVVIGSSALHSTVKTQDGRVNIVLNKDLTNLTEV